MPRKPKRASLTETERDELHAWLTAEKINPSRIRRDFADVKPTATLLNKYYPELVDVNFYPPRNSVTSKMSNWEQFNKRVLTKLGLKLTREDMEQVSRSIPGSIDMLLYKIMKLHNIQRSYEQSGSESDNEDIESLDKDKSEADDALAAAISTSEAEKTSPLLSEAQLTVSATNKSPTYSNIDLDSTEATTATTVKAVAPASGNEGVPRPKKRIAIASDKQLTGMEYNSNSNYYNTKKAHVIKQSSKDGFMIVSLPIKIGDKMRTVTKKLVPINEFNKALRESRRKDAKIEHFHQKLAHLQNLIELKKEHIGELRSKIQKSNGKPGILKNDDDREAGIPSPPTVMSKLSNMNPIVRFNVNVGDDCTTKRKHGGAATSMSRWTTTTNTRKTKSSSTVKRSKPPILGGGVAVIGAKSVKNTKGKGKQGGPIEKGSRTGVKGEKLENKGAGKQQKHTTITAATDSRSGANKKLGILKRKNYRKPIYRTPPRPRSICIVTNNKYACDSLYDERQ